MIKAKLTLNNPKAKLVPRRTMKPFPMKKIGIAGTTLSKSFHSKIFTLFASSVSDITSFAQRVYPHFSFCFCFTDGEQHYWYFDVKDAEKVRKWVLKKCQTSTQDIFKIYNAWQKDWINFEKFNRRLLKTDISKLNDLKLVELLEKYHTAYILAGSTGYMCDSFMTTGSVDWLEALLEKEIKKLNPNYVITKQEIAILTNPSELSYSGKSELDILKIALRTLQTFNKLPTFTSLQNHSALRRTMGRHVKKYYWIENNYFNAKFLYEKDIYQKIYRIILEFKTDRAIIQKITRIKKHQKDIAKRKVTLLRTLKISHFTKNVLKTCWLFGLWKDTRKSGVCMGMEFFDRFLHEISKRTPYTKSDLTFTVLPEIRQILLEHKNLRLEIKGRKKQAFFSVTKNDYFIVGGRNAEPYYSFYRKVTALKKQDLKGVVANPGMARGKVRIVLKTSEIKNFKAGEILVTNQTTPDFVPAMKKAAAIITEQGGITSHAAIISRELHKPCIIGTKIATRILKNGDLIEVNANIGIIKKLI
jgi:phosphohistidine swiveling domain-containing protein